MKITKTIIRETVEHALATALAKLQVQSPSKKTKKMLSGIVKEFAKHVKDDLKELNKKNLKSKKSVDPKISKKKKAEKEKDE
jgi:hypothetical protein